VSGGATVAGEVDYSFTSTGPQTFEYDGTGGITAAGTVSTSFTSATPEPEPPSTGGGGGFWAPETPWLKPTKFRPKSFVYVGSGGVSVGGSAPASFSRAYAATRSGPVSGGRAAVARTIAYSGAGGMLMHVATPHEFFSNHMAAEDEELAAILALLWLNKCFNGSLEVGNARFYFPHQQCLGVRLINDFWSKAGVSVNESPEYVAVLLDIDLKPNDQLPVATASAIS
jgi:hypothetical protein